MSKSVHPDVRKFKSFVKNNPYVLRDVKKGEKTLQDLFEEYMLFGEDDDIWESYKQPAKDEEDVDDDPNEEESVDEEKSSKDSSTAKDLLEVVKKMNMNDLQKNLAQISGVLGSVQGLLLQFKQDNNQGSNQNNVSNENQSPFSYRDD